MEGKGERERGRGMHSARICVLMPNDSVSNLISFAPCQVDLLEYRNYAFQRIECDALKKKN